ncbi:unnamed protein product [Heterosigma akashiwo]
MGVWCTYFTCLAFFHFMEFTSTAFYVPYSLGYSSWIINHSKAYTLASIVRVGRVLARAPGVSQPQVLCALARPRAGPGHSGRRPVFPHGCDGHLRRQLQPRHSDGEGARPRAC